MIKKLFFLPVLLFGVLIFSMQSCGEKCSKKDCGNGICDEIDATCNCDPGYEYDADGSCTVQSSAKFLGSYNINEVCGGMVFDFVGSISANSDLTRIQLNNVWDNFQSPVIATIDGTSITIARQEPDNDDYFVEGTGTFTAGTGGTKDKIVINLKVTDEPPGGTISTSNCVDTWTKQ